MCAAKFADDEWYRARVERTQGGQIHVMYVDYGNREVTSSDRCASLPAAFTTDKPYANEFTLAFVKLPPEVSLFETNGVTKSCVFEGQRSFIGTDSINTGKEN